MFEIKTTSYKPIPFNNFITVERSDKTLDSLWYVSNIVKISENSKSIMILCDCPYRTLSKYVNLLDLDKFNPDLFQSEIIFNLEMLSKSEQLITEIHINHYLKNSKFQYHIK